LFDFGCGRSELHTWRGGHGPSLEHCLVFGQPFAQPAVFWSARVHDRLCFDESLAYCLDFAFFAELLYRFGPPAAAGRVLATFRVHAESKGARMASVRDREGARILAAWNQRLPWLRRLELKRLRWKRATDARARTLVQVIRRDVLARLS
jgi:hypothetical protein